MSDDCEIMGDEKDGQPEVPLHSQQQVDDLGPDRHVECGYRLISHREDRLDHRQEPHDRETGHALARAGHPAPAPPCALIEQLWK